MEYVVGAIVGFIISWIILQILQRSRILGEISPDQAVDCCGPEVEVSGNITIEENETLVAVYAQCLPQDGVPSKPGSAGPIETPNRDGPSTHPYTYLITKDHDPGQVVVWAEFRYYDVEATLFDCTSSTNPCTTSAIS